MRKPNVKQVLCCRWQGLLLKDISFWLALILVTGVVNGQSINKEYIRLGGRVVAIENSASATSSFSYLPASLTFSAAASARTVNISSGSSVSWAASLVACSIDCPSLTLSGSSGTGPGSFTVNALSNSSGRTLAGAVHFTLSDGSVPDLAVTQSVSSTPPTTLSVAPASISGLSQIVTATYSDSSGAANITKAGLLVQLVGSYPSEVNACSVYYDKTNGNFYLKDGSFVVPGSTGVTENSQCVLSGSGSGVSATGNTLTVNFAISLKSTFAGAMTVGLEAENWTGASNWQSKGTWASGPVQQAPTNSGMVPSSTSAAVATQTFSFKFSSPNGFEYISFVQAGFNWDLDGHDGCFVQYVPGSNLIYLLDNNDSSFGTGYVPGTVNQLSNGQCTLNVQQTSVSGSFNDLTVNANITFGNGFPGPQKAFALAQDRGGYFTNGLFQQEGTWTGVTAQPGLPTGSLDPGSGTSPAGTYTSFVYHSSDVNGAKYIPFELLAFLPAGVSFNSPNTCQLIYYRGWNAILLMKDDGSWDHSEGEFNQGVHLGTPGASPLSNSQCSVDVANGTVSSSGGNLTLTLPVSFTANYTGPTLYRSLAIFDHALQPTFLQPGTWNAPQSTPPTTLSVAPASISGLSQIVTATYSDSSGAANITKAGLLVQLVGSYPSEVNACSVYYDKTNGNFYLKDGSFVVPGSTGVTENSQCVLSGSGSGVSATGNTLTVNFAISLKSTFAGAMTVGLEAENWTGASNWQSKGTWASGPVQQAPTNSGMVPSSTSAAVATQTFSFKFSSPNGFEYISFVQAGFNWDLDGHDGCFVQYVPGSNLIYLLDNNDSSFGTGYVPGTVNQLSNGQCTLNVQQTSVSGSFNDLTVNANITFGNGFPGPQKAFALAQDRGGYFTNGLFQQEGTWTGVTAQPGLPTGSLDPGSGTSPAGTYTSFVYHSSDVNGAKYIPFELLAFLPAGVSFNSPNTCQLIYYRGWNAILLMKDDGSWDHSEGEFNQGVHLGTPGASPLSNSQCSVDVANGTVSSSGGNLTLTLPVSFTANYTGPTLYRSLAIFDHALQPTFLQPGTWNAPSASFTLTGGANPSSVVGGTATYLVTVSSSNSFGGVVSFSTSGLPAGASVSFNPTTVTASGSTTLSISGLSAAGSYPFTVTGSSSGIPNQTLSPTLTVTSAPDFTVSLGGQLGTVPVAVQNPATYAVGVTGTNGFNSVVSFNSPAAGLPNGTTASFNPGTTTGSGSSVLSLKGTRVTPTSSINSFTVSGTAGSSTRTSQASNFNVIHQALSLSNPINQNGGTGTSGSFGFTATSPLEDDLFQAQVQLLNASGGIQCIAFYDNQNQNDQVTFGWLITYDGNGFCSLPSHSITPGANTSRTVQFNLNFNPSVASGTFTVKYGATNYPTEVSVLDGGSFTVPGPSFTLTGGANPSSVVGGTATYLVTVSSSNSFGGVVSFSTSGLPAGASVSFNPTTVTASGSTTLSISGLSAAGSYPFTVTGSSSGIPNQTLSPTLTVTSAPDFTVSLGGQLGTVPVAVQNPATYAVGVTGTNGFNSVVSFNSPAAGLPNGTTASFNPGTTTGSGSSVLSLKGTRVTPTSSINSFTVSGTAGSSTRTSQASNFNVIHQALSLSNPINQNGGTGTSGSFGFTATSPLEDDLFQAQVQLLNASGGIQCIAFYDNQNQNDQVTFGWLITYDGNGFCSLPSHSITPGANTSRTVQFNLNFNPSVASGTFTVKYGATNYPTEVSGLDGGSFTVPAQ